MRMHDLLLVLAGLATATTARAGEAPAHSTQPPPAPPAFEVCRGTLTISGSTRPGLPGGPLKVTAYLSDIMPRGPINDEDIRVAYEQYLGEKYSPNIRTECSYAYTRADAEKVRADFRKGLEGQTVVETGWQYAAPSKAAAPPPGQYAVCWANMNATVKYYSAVFDGSRDDAGKWWPAFQAHLRQKYGFDGPTQCIPPGGKADVETYLKNLIEKDRKTRTMQGQPPQIVETGWKY